MKVLIIFIVLLVILSYVHGLACKYLKEYLVEPLNTSSISVWHNYIYKIPSENKTMCKISIIAMYSDKQIQVRLGGNSFAFERMVDGNVIYRNIQWVLEKIVQDGEIYHTCSTHDLCEIDFLFQHIHWIINGFQENLLKFSQPILIGTREKLRMFHIIK